MLEANQHMATVSSTAGQSAPTRQRNPLREFFFDNRRAFSALAILIVMLTIFYLANPDVFGNPTTYRSVFLTLPVAIFLVVPSVFVVTTGEVDLSFPSTMGFAAYGFALAVDAGYDPFIGFIIALIMGAFIGTINGILIVYFNLSSLVTTLGMNFLLRGLINIGAEGFSIALPELRDTFFYNLLAGPNEIGVPTQMFWAILFVLGGWVLYNRHRFGARVHCVGDNPDSAAEMGINVKRIRVSVFVFMGIGAALAGVFSVLVNTVWWPTSGDGYLLTNLAAVFVGGTPTWGGVGTVVGGALGAVIVAFIEPGILAAGMSGFYTQFFNGLIIMLSIVGHRFNGRRYR
ncbi:MAG: ABC transporter permease [Chloroflexi bacterium]|nr:ABC transporter permease [Chloroflexota bacterium]